MKARRREQKSQLKVAKILLKLRGDFLFVPSENCPKKFCILRRLKCVFEVAMLGANELWNLGRWKPCFIAKRLTKEEQKGA